MDGVINRAKAPAPNNERGFYLVWENLGLYVE